MNYRVDRINLFSTEENTNAIQVFSFEAAFSSARGTGHWSYQNLIFLKHGNNTKCIWKDNEIRIRIIYPFFPSQCQQCGDSLARSLSVWSWRTTSTWMPSDNILVPPATSPSLDHFVTPWESPWQKTPWWMKSKKGPLWLVLLLWDSRSLKKVFSCRTCEKLIFQQ